LVINLLLEKLFAVKFLLLVDKWQWWDDNLWILFDHVVPELNKIDVKSLDFPPEWMSLENNHERLRSHDLPNF
jgi:hypothetical protein